MDVHQDASGGGRWVPAWVPTFNGDVLPGDKIRRDGVEHFVVGREYTPSYQPTFCVDYGTGGETLAKVGIVLIWDADGSVTQRVKSLSAAAIR